MRQCGILGIYPCGNLIHTCPFRKNRCLVGGHTVLEIFNYELALVLNMEISLIVGRTEQHLYTYILRFKAADIKYNLGLQKICRRKAV